MKTSEELHALHRELWGWLAETGRPWKSEWPGWKENAAPHYCFACGEMAYRGRGCRSCPVEWEASDCEAGDSAFLKWLLTDSRDDRKKYAAIIRDLPWSPRPEVEAMKPDPKERRS